MRFVKCEYYYHHLSSFWLTYPSTFSLIDFPSGWHISVLFHSSIFLPADMSECFRLHLNWSPCFAFPLPMSPSPVGKPGPRAHSQLTHMFMVFHASHSCVHVCTLTTHLQWSQLTIAVLFVSPFLACPHVSTTSTHSQLTVHVSITHMRSNMTHLGRGRAQWFDIRNMYQSTYLHVCSCICLLVQLLVHWGFSLFSMIHFTCL